MHELTPAQMADLTFWLKLIVACCLVGWFFAGLDCLREFSRRDAARRRRP